MDWKDAVQFRSDVLARFAEPKLSKLRDLYDCHYLMWAALPADKFVPHDDYLNALPLSAYGAEAVSRLVDIRAQNSPSVLALAALTVFYHRDFLIDVDQADVDLLTKRLDIDFRQKAIRLAERSRDDYGLYNYVLSDYKGRKLSLRGPKTVSGLRNVSFTSPVIVPYGNLLGQPNAEVILAIVEESEFSKLWQEYPRPRKVDEQVLQSPLGGETPSF